MDAQMSEEMRLHLEMEAEAKVAAGLSPDEAREAALREFGNVASIQEKTRHERGWVWLEQWVKDVLFTVRSLVRARGFSLTVISILVVGITVAAVVLSYTNWILFGKPPFPEPERLVMIGTREKGGEISTMCIGPQFLAYRDQTAVFSEFAALEMSVGNMLIDDSPRVTSIGNVSIDFFHTLGLKPVLGRTFLPEDFDPGGTEAVVISNKCWKDQFGSKPEVIGRRIRINQQVCTIVGVVPVLNNYPASEIYRPLVVKADPVDAYRSWLMVAARLKPGVTSTEATAALSSVKIEGLPGWAEASFKEKQVLLRGMFSLFDPTPYWLLFAAGALLYVSACLNAMNLMLARLITRQRELSVRLSLGGSRWQTGRLFLLEGLLLALAASVVAAVLSRWSYPILSKLFSGDTAIDWSPVEGWWESFRVAWWSGPLGWLSVLAGIAMTILPLWRVLKSQDGISLKDCSPSHGETRKVGRLRDGLAVLQAAFAVILLVGTGLMIRSFDRIHHLDYGFSPVGKVKVEFRFPDDFQATPETKLALFERLCAQLKQLPGVKGATYGVDALFGGEWHGEKIKLPDGTERDVSGQQVAANFAEVAGLTLVKGRWFSAQTSNARDGITEAVINETMARQFFGDRNPLGELIPDRRQVIVGVVRDLRGELRVPAGLHYYYPAWTNAGFLTNITLKMDTEPSMEFAGLVQRAVYAVEPRLIVPSVSSVNQSLAMRMWAENLAYSMLKGVTPIACVLALAGLFSVLAYNVETRRKEFGVRLALGASPMNLHRLVLKRGVATAALGVVAGSLCSLGLTRFIQSLLFETAPYDVPVYVAVALTLLPAAAVACWLPARRAAKVDPVISLRAE